MPKVPIPKLHRDGKEKGTHGPLSYGIEDGRSKCLEGRKRKKPGGGRVEEDGVPWIVGATLGLYQILIWTQSTLIVY